MLTVHNFDDSSHRFNNGCRPPHCMLFANTIYDWPFDLAHAGGDAVDVLDIHGMPHMESCDPGIFPSFFYDYGNVKESYLVLIYIYIYI